MPVNQISQPFALSANVAASGTVVVGYPTLPFNVSQNYYQNNAPNANLGSGNFTFSDGKHTLKVGNNIYNAPKDFTLSFGNVSAGITITNRTAGTWPAGASCVLGLDLNGALSNSSSPISSTRVTPVRELFLDLGAPVAAAVAGIAAVQLLAAAGNLTLNGSVVSSGVAYLDVPRNVTLTVATTNHSAITFTITGKDEFGNTMVETIAGPNNNTVSGIKAFAQVTRVAANAAIATNGVSVGFGTTLGLPIAVRRAGQITKEMLDGANATAGTFAYALTNAAATATNADVRGTYIPNSAPDGVRGFTVGVLVPDGSDIGVAQFAG
jgi:hypothetical protein